MEYSDLIAKMTLEEKCSLLSGKGQFHTPSIKRLDIPSMHMADGPNGVRKQAGSGDHLGLNASVPATCYPAAATIANAWDLQLTVELGEYLGKEAASHGLNVLLGPGLNIKRSPLGGRNFEYYSEDPYLAGKISAAYIHGVQSNGVSACPKHLAVNSQELRRMHNDSIVDERAFREIYLTGFEIAAKEGKPLSIMSSYNRLNGIYTSEDKRLLNDILRDEWKFDGIVITDWGGSNDRVSGLVAGENLEMPTSGGLSDREVLAAVRNGEISEELVDRRVNEYLKVLYTTSPKRPQQNIDYDRHHSFARHAAEQGIVLLKNEEELLPLKAGTRVAVVGDFAEIPRFQGAGSSHVNATKRDNALEELKDSGLDIIGYAGGFNRYGGENERKTQEAIALVQNADVVLLYLGLDEKSESEGFDRQHMQLPENQIKLLHELQAVNDRIAVVLCGGAAVETSWLSGCKVLLHGYLGGQAGAGAMVNVIIGKVNPSGKLAESWAKTLSDTPTANYFPGTEQTSEYREGIFVGYRYYQSTGVEVTFPFGYGLSYTTFRYSDLVIDDSGVSFTITNMGSRDGAEVAQLYIGKPISALYRAKRELKGFVKLNLKAGESQRATIPFDEYSFRYYDTDTQDFEIEAGEYSIEIGASSEDIRLSGMIARAGSGAIAKNRSLALPSYYTGQIQNVSDAEFEKLLGRSIPPALWDRSQLLDRNDTFSQLFYAKGWVGRLVYRILNSQKKKAEQQGEPDLNIMFIYNMPFRGMEKMTAGAVSRRMVDGLLDIFNGHFFAGLGAFISGWRQKRREDKESKAALGE